MEKTVSLQMSSLAVDDIDDVQNHETMEVRPELYVVEPRHLSRIANLIPMSSLDEVISIGGRFTVSF